MAVSIPFGGPKLKVARGRKHTAELQTEIGNYLSRLPYGIFLQQDTQTGDHSVEMGMRERIPADLVIIFGDAIHNIRTALDLLANDLVALSGEFPKGVYFPFSKTAEDLENQIKGKMSSARSDILDIVRSLKPYPGGNDLLRAIHDLDITDKHKTLLAVSMVQTFSSPMRNVVVDRLTIQAEPDWAQLPIEVADMAGYHFPPSAKTIIGRVKGVASNVALSEGAPLGGTPVIEALDKAASLVEGIIKIFEAHCLRFQPSSVE